MSTPLPWIKMHTSLPTHRKSLELALELGVPRAWTYQAALLLWAGEHAQDGRIRGKHRASLVEHAAQWEGERGRLVSALLTVGFLEEEGEELIIHGWTEEQGAHVAKVSRDRSKPDGRTSRKAPEEIPTFPCETPASLPQESLQTPARDIRGQREIESKKEKETTLSGKPDLVVVLDSESAPEETTPAPERDAVSGVFDYWRQRTGYARAKLDDKRRRAVKARLKDGYSPEDLRRAIDGCMLTPHNCGQNERGERYDDLELICRSGPQVDRFMRNATDPPKAEKRGPGADWRTDWSGPPKVDADGQQAI